MIWASSTQQPLAYYPARLQSMSWSPAHRVWAARRENHLCLLRLEGSPAVTEQALPPPSPQEAEDPWELFGMEEILPYGPGGWSAVRRRNPEEELFDQMFRSDYLEIIDAQGRRFVKLDKESFVIGREPTCDICLTESSVSRRHAQLQRNDEGAWLLQDLNSRNHVYYNEQPIQQVVLERGKPVRIGGYRLALRRMHPK